jgi:hypothetical protein
VTVLSPFNSLIIPLLKSDRTFIGFMNEGH